MFQNFENQPQNQPEILRAINKLIPQIVLHGETTVEHPENGYVPATGHEFDAANALIEVNEVDPNAPPVDGRLTQNIHYETYINTTNKIDKLGGYRARFLRDLGMIEGRQHVAEYDVLSDGSITKSVFKIDGDKLEQIPTDFSEQEEQNFIRQISNVLSVGKLPLNH